jgi:hypothetical protein
MKKKNTAIKLLLMAVVFASCATQVSGPPDLSVTAYEVTRDWNENPINAGFKYDNKIISITGEIKSIDDGYITLNASSPILILYYEGIINSSPLFCIFKKNETNRSILSKLNPDQQITVIGKAKRIRYVTGGFGPFNYKRNWIELTGCSIIGIQY